MKRLLGCIALLLAACAHHAPPPFVTRLDTAPAVRTTPGSHPDEWLLAFLDVETTGLVPGYHEMIDAGMVITDLRGMAIDQLFIRIQPEHPERLAEGARQVNAFDAAKWKQLGALSGREAISLHGAGHSFHGMGSGIP